ncbi:MAG: hypothetical protein HYT98_05380 [Candidatus Sungbacteria bacterium]|nr:hypothetical protein [Candidatus Sungbacteria bacterium]
MKKYFAWVAFVFGVINLSRFIAKLIVDPKSLPPTLFTVLNGQTTLENIVGVLFSFFLWGLFSFSFYLWWRWK